MTVVAIVVTHQSGDVVEECLRSIERHDSAATVLVVDSGSPDGPPVLGNTEVIAVPENQGFGTSVNTAVLRQDGPLPDIIATLNPDVRLVGPSLSELARGLAERPDVGIATGPVIDDDGLRQPSAWGPPSAARALWFAAGWRLPRVRQFLSRFRGSGALTSTASMGNEEFEVDGHVLGGAMIVRRECWEQLGGFDEDFFLYWEDADLCQRARNFGWKVAVLPCTPIVHIAGTSSAGVTSDQRWKWYVDGARLFADKHLTPTRKLRLLLALRFGRLLRPRK